MRHAKKSTNRDFKVIFRALPDADERGEEGEAETEDDEVSNCSSRRRCKAPLACLLMSC